MSKLIGTQPNQVPSNADLGDLAYQNTSNVVVDNLRIGNINLGSTPRAWLTVIKDNDNSGNQVVIADGEGATAAIRTYSIPGSSGDPAGLILNHYYAQTGSGNQYMRYADFVANVGNGAGTTMRFITKNAANTYSTGLKIDNNGKVYVNSGYANGNFGMYIQGKGAGSADARALHVRGFGGHTTIGGTGPTLVLQNADGTTNNVTKLSFETASNGEAVSINCINTNHSSFYGDMAFNTRSSTGYSEKLRIMANGNVGIGTDNPKTTLHVETPGNSDGFAVGGKNIGMNTTFQTGAQLEITLGNHQACYVKVFITGDWSGHSAVAFLGEYFVQNGADAYAEAGMIIREVDNTGGPVGDHVSSMIYDGGNYDSFQIQFKLNALSGGVTSMTAALTYQVMGQFDAIT